MADPVIKREWVFLAALLAFVVCIFVLFYKLIVPFFAPIAWAVIFVVTCYPAHQWLSSRVRTRGLAAFISTAAVAILILGPSIWMMLTLFGEARNLYDWIQTGEWTSHAINDLATRIDPIIQELSHRLSGLIDLSNWDFRSIAGSVVERISRWIVDNTSAGLANVGKVVLQFLMMLLTMYYLFKDGAPLIENVRLSIPLPGKRAEEMLSHVTDVVRATIYGGLVVAAIQGTLGGLLFWAVGLPSPVLWGAVMAFFALIPLLGAFVVYIPAAVVLFAGGSYIKALVLLGVGIGLVSQIDNILRPMLISGKTQMHPLLLFFSIAGGVSVFGLLGLVLGPVIAAIFIALLEVYRIALSTPEPE
jgi:predicted PurR-regulated permease PerM